ncbi:general stress protein [Bacillus albus]|uniref:general stress protein n=1 Tax=Bacillus cereus group TaxID=86661 RepID=UPI0022DEDF75|nr:MULTISPECIES: general stress protein [Bacillus cereus group]MDA2219351.1 general stress protein [Bacillus cereus group sp. Bc228]MDA2228631.1 general stress protein [Bacillus cereus group sp. Bc227]MDA2263657.1 general stress protein [Bacillus cereus group sp. Bc200]MDA2325163.1 general stress protein [Bacillus cereus group sp. Bc177]HDR7718384.1 general stress protein [Bacillus albus]
MKRTLEKRLSYLYTGELFSVITFIFTSYLLNYAYPTLYLYSLYSFWVSFLLLEFILLQGTLYWYVKWKRLKKEKISVTPIRMIHYLKVLKKINIAFIIAGFITVTIDFVIWYPDLPLGGLSFTLFIYIFALLEYINYYHTQLSYDNISDIKHLIKSKKLKQSCISKDFQRIS